MLYDSKIVMITGGTGSFGQEFVKYLLQHNVKKVIVFSRDEMKQWQMAKNFKDSRMRFFLGDVRDKDRLSRAMNNVDIVIHAAATKIVPLAEYNPFECVKTNVNGAMNIVDVAIDQKVSKVIALSTDKACAPVNLYGATKLASDKIFVSGNNYSASKTKFAVVRYGNVMGSRGSVIPYFMNIKGKLPITDERMTRFMITLEDSIDLVDTALSEMLGGEIFVKKIPSISIMEIAEAINPDFQYEIIGVRPGEKLHEQMITIEDAEYTYEYDGYYKILPSINNWHLDPGRISGGVKVASNFSYSSHINNERMSAKTLRMWIQNKSKDFLKI